MTDKYKNWNSEIPAEEGRFWMKDSSGGPTLYIFKIVDGVLMNGPKPRADHLQWFSWPTDAPGHLSSAKFKRANKG